MGEMEGRRPLGIWVQLCHAPCGCGTLGNQLNSLVLSRLIRIADILLGWLRFSIGDASLPYLGVSFSCQILKQSN